MQTKQISIKEKKIRHSIIKMYAHRNLKFNEHHTETLVNELLNEKIDILDKLFKKIYNKSFYSDSQHTIQRMPCLIEIKEELKKIKQYNNYITPDHFCIQMPAEEKLKKQQIHFKMTSKIKEWIQNGAKEEEYDAIFAKN